MLIVQTYIFVSKTNFIDQVAFMKTYHFGKKKKEKEKKERKKKTKYKNK